MSRLVVQDGKVRCPNCGGMKLTHAYDCTYRTTGLRVEDDEIVAYGHKPDECHAERVFCLDCSWAEDPCEIQVE